MSDIYERLRARLDDMATGYPETDGKIEIRLLERLFTREEAELFLQLTPFLQKPADVAKQLNSDPDKISDMMEHMAQKGLLFRKRKGDLVRYAACSSCFMRSRRWMNSPGRHSPAAGSSV